jgi:hypothetical protein
MRRKFTVSSIRGAFLIWLTTNYGNTHEVLMIVPRSYPIRPPIFYTLSHIKGQYKLAHIYYDDERLCLYEKLGRDWDSKECDLITAIGWAAMWLFCQEFFQKHGYWPAPQSHKPKLIRQTEPYDARRRR